MNWRATWCKLKIYKNLNTGEVIEAKSGNYIVLSALKVECGANIVEGWLKNPSVLPEKGPRRAPLVLCHFTEINSLSLRS
ncbi:hypothetical protein [Pseudomonas syringae]|uniref:hypothetical protein n=1 Tax=Pseudomonas syringae TaxID=317 RepID=UPI003D6810FB